MSTPKTTEFLKPEFLKDDYGMEKAQIQVRLARMGEMPVSAWASVEGGFTPEGIALALVRTHMRMSLLVNEWEKDGCDGDATGTMRLIRSDMRVLAELSTSMFDELLSLGATGEEDTIQ